MHGNIYKKTLRKYDIFVITATVLVVFLATYVMGAYGDKSVETANRIFVMVTTSFKALVLLFFAALTLFLLWLAISKYGSIKLGDEKPEYSRFTWMCMVFCSGMGASTLYWSFIEWAYYFTESPGILGDSVTNTSMAYELSIAYNLFHWGPAGWSAYAIFAIILGYFYYVKKNNSLRLSSVCTYYIQNEKIKIILGKAIDVLTMLLILASGGLAITFESGVLSKCIGGLFHIENNFSLVYKIVLIITFGFAVSSYLGIKKGMKRISDIGIFLSFVLIIFVLFVGDTISIFDQSLSGIGLLFDKYFRFSTWTDPINSTGFVGRWTVFFFLSWLGYGPYVGTFIAKISRGRTFREIIFSLLVLGSMGGYLYHLVLGGYSRNLNITGRINAVSYVQNADPEGMISDVLSNLPMHNAVTILFVVIIVLLLMAALDAITFSLSTSSLRCLEQNEEPKPKIKLFWCIVLISYPMVLLFIDAPLNIIKTGTTVIALPLIFIMTFLIYKFYMDLKKNDTKI